MNSDNSHGLKRKPNLYVGKKLPLYELNADDFEKFVYATLEEVGQIHGFSIVGKSTEPSDGGFDVTGRRIKDKKIVCIQCKRYKETLQLSHVSKELAKVAFQSATESSDVVEHYFITTGDISDKLQSANRETDRKTLVESSLKAANDPKRLTKLRKKMQDQNRNIDDTVKNYINKLEEIIFWSGSEFDLQLGNVWSKLSETIEKYFTVTPVLLEHPRPDFDENAYLEKCKGRIHEELIPLFLIPGNLPKNLATKSYADPSAHYQTLNRGSEKKSEDTFQSYEATENLKKLTDTVSGKCILLVGDGGSGKTTTLRSLSDKISQIRLQNKQAPLPIFVDLSRYQNDLEKIINNELEIIYGCWKYIPENFLLLCDGLNEIPASSLRNLVQELSELLSSSIRERINCIISVRPSGVAQPIILPVTEVFEISPLTMNSIRKLAAKKLIKNKHSDFLDEIRKKIAYNSPGLFRLPYGIVMSIGVFEKDGCLPLTINELIEEYLSLRFKRNQEISSDIDIPNESIKKIAKAIAFKVRFEKERNKISLDEAQEFVGNVFSKLKKCIFGLDAINSVQAFRLLEHYEIIKITSDDFVNFEHDVVLDYLASEDLSKKWESYRNTIKESRVYDAVWIYASSQISVEQQNSFLEFVTEIDLLLCAVCALEMGEKGIAIAEDLIINKYEKNNSELKSWRRLLSLGTLGTKNCIDYLKKCLSKTEPLYNKDRHYEDHRIKIALAMSGDEEFLSEIFPQVERELPFVSGGILSIWEKAPINIQLKLAKKRIEKVNNPDPKLVQRSVHIIALYGDKADARLIEKVMDQLLHNIQEGEIYFYHFFKTLSCLYELDPSKTIDKMLSILKSKDTLNNITLMYVLYALFKLGEEVDIEWILNFLTDDVELQYKESDLRILDDAKEKALEILMKTPLSSKIRDSIQEKYNQADDKIKGFLWRIAIAHKLESFDELAFFIIRQDLSNEIAMYLPEFALKREWESDVDRKFIEYAIYRVQNDTDLWYTLAYPYLLEYLLEKGEKELVSEKIKWIFSELLEANRICLLGQRTVLPGRINILDKAKDEDIEFKIQMEFIKMLPLCSRVAEFIPKNLINSLMRINFSFLKDAEKYMEILLKKFDADELDNNLMEISDRSLRIWLLSIVSRFGGTKIRLQILEDELAQSVVKSDLNKAIINMWDEETAQAVVRGIIKAQWSEKYGDYFIDKISITMQQRVSKLIAERYIKPNLSRELHPLSRKYLQLWYESGIMYRTV